ncbi:MAG: endopeptidase La [Thermaerobacterales bacterium]
MSTYPGVVQTLPLLPLRGMVVFPGFSVTLHVGRAASLSALNEALQVSNRIGLATQRDQYVEEPQPDEIHEIGTVADIQEIHRHDDGTTRVVLTGFCRARMIDITRGSSGLWAKLEQIPDPDVDSAADERLASLMAGVMGQYDQWLRLAPKMPSETLATITAARQPERFADVIAVHVLKNLDDKQAVLAALATDARLEKVYEGLSKEIEMMRLQSRVQDRVHNQMESTQKEYYLREQIRAIQKELGESDEATSEIDEFRSQMDEKNLPPAAEERLARELGRLEKMSGAMAEAVVIRNYVEWLLALPWRDLSEDHLDLDRAEEILDQDHHGLQTIKDRIIEYLAVRSLAKDLKGPILCLTGPPGVGKTSLARSVARSLGRQFVRLSLGGVRDEAEIRGHRRTYIGALPGRIIQGMRQAGTRNPVFLLDEIDKMGFDHHGDPSAALLEALDPEQNGEFSDHFIELPFDLSQVLFITTANVVHPIPAALRDRLEIVHLSGYTEDEKIAICKQHLIPRQVEAHGLSIAQFGLSDQALRQVVRGYTREAGVRQLERQMAGLCRKAARRVVQGRADGLRINVQNLEKHLGRPQFRTGSSEHDVQVGVATAVAWTHAGGDVMPVEVVVLPGKGGLFLTGQMGEVMRESARAALSYVRSRSCELEVDEAFYKDLDIHVHIPEGAVPKDGPSAGACLATALASSLTGRPVRSDVGMTGEITLRGRILPVGGVKEKVLAAHRAGVKMLLLPAENERDLDDVPAAVIKQMNIVPVEHVDQILAHVLMPRPQQARDDARPEKGAAGRWRGGAGVPFLPVSAGEPQPVHPASGIN